MLASDCIHTYLFIYLYFKSNFMSIQRISHVFHKTYGFYIKYLTHPRYFYKTLEENYQLNIKFPSTLYIDNMLADNHFSIIRSYFLRHVFFFPYVSPRKRVQKNVAMENLPNYLMLQKYVRVLLHPEKKIHITAPNYMVLLRKLQLWVNSFHLCVPMIQ